MTRGKYARLRERFERRFDRLFPPLDVEERAPVDKLSSVRGLPLALVLSALMFGAGGVLGALILRAWGAQ